VGVRKTVHDDETSALSSSDGANSLHGSFGSGPSPCGRDTSWTSSSYGWFSARKLETIR
jgi:hypothetical protein